MNDVESKLQANIPKVLILNGAWMFLVLMPVIVPFFQHYGLDMEQIYILLSIYAISIVILEVPSGYISDLLGRKRTLVLSGVFQGVGFTILALSSSYEAFIAFELFNAISLSLFSGTDVALIYDSQALLKTNRLSDAAVLARRIFYSQVGETIAALLGGYLAVISLTLPAKINAVTAWVPLLISLSLYEPARKKLDPRQHLLNLRHIYKVLFKESKLLTLVIFNYISLGLAGYIVVWAFQGFWKDMGIPLSYFGYLWAGYNLTVAVSGRVAHRIERKIGSTPILLIMGILPIVGFLGMASFVSALGIVFGLAFNFCRGLNQVIVRDALNSRVGAEIRATANSIASLGVRLMFALLGPLMGYLIESRGYSFAFYCFAGLYGIFFLVLCLPLLRQRQNFKPVSR